MPDDAPYLLDVTRLIWRRSKGRLPTGIDRVCLAYLKHFGPNAQAVISHQRFRRILGRNASQELFGLLGNSEQYFRSRLTFGALRHLRDLNAKGESRPYLNVGHTGLDAPGFVDWVNLANVRPVYLVHDLIPITHPQFCRTGEDIRHRERMRSVLTTATGVIGNSQATLDELATFASAESLRRPPMLAALLGADPLVVQTRPSSEVLPSFVILGTIEGRKNHQLLLDIWSKLIDRLGNKAPKLLIIGQRGWEAEQIFDRLDHDEKLRSHVTELNSCSDEELARHLASARALLFPSFVEGYGLPLIEALGAGLPAIAGDLPVFREICGNIPTYLGHSDEEGWERAILDFADPGSIARASQLERLKDFRAPNWKDHFDQVEAWLTTLG